MPAALYTVINNCFNTVDGSKTYRLAFQLYVSSPSYSPTSVDILIYKGIYPGSGLTTLQSVNIVEDQWSGVDFTATIPKDYTTIRISPSPTPRDGTMYIKNLKIIQYKKAEVQDSEMNWAGRRTSYYEGTKITSTDINVDSADTIDGGPVITVNTVNSDQPSYDPLGVSTIITGTTNTNQSQ